MHTKRKHNPRPGDRYGPGVFLREEIARYQGVTRQGGGVRYAILRCVYCGNEYRRQVRILTRNQKWHRGCANKT